MTDPTIAELAALVTAGLDADEALAFEAPGSRWHIGNAVDPMRPCNVHTFPEVREVADGLNWLVAEHVARHDPARVLAEVASKRALLDLALGWGHDVSLSGAFGEPSRRCRSSAGQACDCGRDERVLAVLQHLAQPYRD
jgi:hypothetical protein